MYTDSPQTLEITDVRTAVLRKIEEMIISGQIPANKKIQEEEIAGALGVSRTPVRDALHRLEETGMVQRIPRRGTFVRQIDPNEVEEIYTIRALLEGNAVRKAAENRTDNDLEVLRQITAQMKQALERGKMRDLVALNEQFHEWIAGFSGPLTKSLVSRFSYRISRYRAVAMTHNHRDQEAYSEHRRILAAIEKQSADDAEHEIIRHTSNGLRAIKGLFERYGPELPDAGFLERRLRSFGYSAGDDQQQAGGQPRGQS